MTTAPQIFHARGRLSEAIVNSLSPKKANAFLTAREITLRVQALGIDTTGIHSILANLKKRKKIFSRKNRSSKRLEYALLD